MTLAELKANSELWRKRFMLAGSVLIATIVASVGIVVVMLFIRPVIGVAVAGVCTVLITIAGIVETAIFSKAMAIGEDYTSALMDDLIRSIS